LPHVPPQYLLLEQINQGGMGIIYRARHRYTGSMLAIKFLHGDQIGKQEALKRFHFEAKTAMALTHNNITRVHDFGINEDNIPFFVMDWIDGISLAKKIDCDGVLNIDEALSVTMQTAQALVYAHSQKIVHRDMKPENLMLVRDHTGCTSVRILDFGIAKALAGPDNQNLTQTGAILGSPIYMSPEQGLGHSTDERSDVYSLACVLYYALLGHPPFMGTSSIETICKHINEPVPPLALEHKTFPEALQNIILKALEKNPADRYQSMNEFLQDLQLFKNGQTVPTRQLLSHRRSKQMILRVAILFVAGFGMTYLLVAAAQTLMAHAR
jgi:eukaryotic-like serine/threonine-protein kinase